MTLKPQSALIQAPIWIFVGLATAISISLAVYQPDRPVATIEPGSSAGPSFVVQVIRPRLGLPIGGLLPLNWFEQEEHIGFNSKSEGASVGIASSGSLELNADGWDLDFVIDEHQHLAAGSEVVFEFIFEGRPRRVRGRFGNPAVGTFTMTQLSGGAELSGSFDLEIAGIEDADTGEALGWPPKPLILHGSFDRLHNSGGTVRFRELR